MNRICAVIVSYNPDDSIISNVNSLIPQVDEVVIVDNGFRACSKVHLDYLSKTHDIKVIYNAHNLGIAAALNTGVKYAIDAGGYTWIATFDQDSLAPQGFISSMLAAYESCEYKQEVAIIAPIYNQDRKSGIISSFGNHQDMLFVNLKTVITSGNLVKANVFGLVGLFDEDFFIDYVDFEFCLRCLKGNHKIIGSCQSVLVHNLGDTVIRTLFGRTLHITNHDSTRRYYATRNRIVVYRRYLFFDPLWCISDLLLFAKEAAKLVLYEKDIASKFSSITKGVYDGLLGRMGTRTFSVNS